MAADNNSSIAWHRAQLKKNLESLKALETARFTMGEIAGSKKIGDTPKAIAELKRKIKQSEQVISAHEKQTTRPRATDLRSLASVRWSSWNGHEGG